MPTINQLASKRVRLVKRHKTKSGALKSLNKNTPSFTQDIEVKYGVPV